MCLYFAVVLFVTLLFVKDGQTDKRDRHTGQADRQTETHGNMDREMT